MEVEKLDGISGYYDLISNTLRYIGIDLLGNNRWDIGSNVDWIVDLVCMDPNLPIYEYKKIYLLECVSKHFESEVCQQIQESVDWFFSVRGDMPIKKNEAQAILIERVLLYGARFALNKDRVFMFLSTSRSLSPKSLKHKSAFYPKKEGERYDDGGGFAKVRSSRKTKAVLRRLRGRTIRRSVDGEN